MPLTVADLATEEKPDWCPGCGDFGILTALKGAVVDAGAEPHRTVVVSGIGCSSKLPHWIQVYGYHTIHGRAVPVATGIKLANHDLAVIVATGDGDCYGIGQGHFIHAMRRNTDITIVAHNNQIYGLTTGQASPTSDEGFKTKSTPGGTIELPINPIALAIAGGATFVSRGFAGEPKHLRSIMVEAIKHRGFSLVDVLQPCVTFNKINTYDWYKSRVYKVNEEPGYQPTERLAAFAKAQEWGARIPIGVIYREERPTLEDREPALASGPLVRRALDDIDLSAALRTFA